MFIEFLQQATVLGIHALINTLGYPSSLQSVAESLKVVFYVGGDQNKLTALPWMCPLGGDRTSVT